MRRTMSCRETVCIVMDSLGHRLSCGSRTALEARLDECPPCREFVVLIKRAPVRSHCRCDVS